MVKHYDKKVTRFQESQSLVVLLAVLAMLRNVSRVKGGYPE